MSNVTPLFSTPVFVFDKYVEDESNFVELANSQEYTANKGGNLISINTSILELPEFSELKLRIQESVDEYINEVLRLDQHEFYITQSWVNFNPIGSSHHIHHHSNSLYSGVYYIKSSGSCIKFHSDDDFHMSGKFLSLDTSDYNLWNSRIWSVPVDDNSVVLFPSSTTHSVDENTTDTDRISLSFNIFIKGSIGSEKSLTHLIL